VRGGIKGDSRQEDPCEKSVEIRVIRKKAGSAGGGERAEGDNRKELGQRLTTTLFCRIPELESDGVGGERKKRGGRTLIATEGKQGGDWQKGLDLSISRGSVQRDSKGGTRQWIKEDKAGGEKGKRVVPT